MLCLPNVQVYHQVEKKPTESFNVLRGVDTFKRECQTSNVTANVGSHDILAFAVHIKISKLKLSNNIILQHLYTLIFIIITLGLLL